MIIALANRAGQVGKSTLAAFLHSMADSEHDLIAVETQSPGIKQWGLPHESIAPDDVDKLYTSMLMTDKAIIDIGSHDFRAMMDNASGYSGLVETVDRWVLPTLPDARFRQNDVIETLQFLLEAGAPMASMRVVVNKVQPAALSRAEADMELLRGKFPGLQVGMIFAHALLQEAPHRVGETLKNYATQTKEEMQRLAAEMRSLEDGPKKEALRKQLLKQASGHVKAASANVLADEGSGFWQFVTANGSVK